MYDACLYDDLACNNMFRLTIVFVVNCNTILYSFFQCQNSKLISTASKKATIAL